MNDHKVIGKVRNISVSEDTLEGDFIGVVTKYLFSHTGFLEGKKLDIDPWSLSIGRLNIRDIEGRQSFISASLNSVIQNGEGVFYYSYFLETITGETGSLSFYYTRSTNRITDVKMNNELFFNCLEIKYIINFDLIEHEDEDAYTGTITTKIQ